MSLTKTPSNDQTMLRHWVAVITIAALAPLLWSVIAAEASIIPMVTVANNGANTSPEVLVRSSGRCIFRKHCYRIHSKAEQIVRLSSTPPSRGSGRVDFIIFLF